MDESRLSALQVTVLAVCFVLNMLDGIDVLSISFAAPAIADEWSVAPEALGVVFSAALVGMTLGAIVLSPLTDVIGRRNMILISLILISAGMLATALAESITQLIALRFAAGLGIGSMLASLTSMVSEYAPERLRDVFILIMHAAYPLGAIIAGFIAADILQAHGWRPLFLIGGGVSLAAIPVVLLLLPESLDYLSRRRPDDALERINRLLARMGHGQIHSLPAPDPTSSATGISALFHGGMRNRTLRLWLSFFMGFATLYFLFSWVVKLAIDSGLALENAIYAGVCLNLGAFFGSISLGALSARVGLTRIIALFFLLGAVFVVVYGTVDTMVALVLLLVFVLMFFVQGAFTGLYAVAARIYPTEVRTTGIGWAIGAGRFGAIFGPIAAGLLLGAGISIGWTFAVFAIPMLFAAILVTGMGVEATESTLEARSR